MDEVGDHPLLIDVVGQDYQDNIPKYSEHPSLWFRQLEVYFQFYKITSQKPRYYYVLEKLPHRVKLAVPDMIEEIPGYRPYDELKHSVIMRMNEICETRARRLLPNVELGNMLPSELLEHMRRVVEGRQIGDTEVRHLWTKCMSQEIRPTLESCTYDSPLDKLADFADNLLENLNADDD
uniref:Inorganic diphosphatase n=1 Tax=Mesocestoides corti TaxID=53468 RepID=A0A5K3EM42_MESCO